MSVCLSVCMYVCLPVCLYVCVCPHRLYIFYGTKQLSFFINISYQTNISLFILIQERASFVSEMIEKIYEFKSLYITICKCEMSIKMFIYTTFYDKHGR